MNLLALIFALLLSLSCTAKHPTQAAQQPAPADTEEEQMHGHHEAETASSMAGPHAHLGPHFRWTTLRPATQADQAAAWDVLRKLRLALAPYREYLAAVNDGYEPFLPNVQQTHYHFTRKWNGFKAAFGFDPKQPTSLLYRKTRDGYELEGAMYTAPKWTSEESLNDRIPLSIAQWHAHVNICLPQKQDMQTADWKRFGPKGSIVTKAECDQAGGRFVPQLFGWMVHVYPFADQPDKIWTH
jgi:diadenosine tetraphosphate (Ap4A) HIT family hydrolase